MIMQKLLYNKSNYVTWLSGIIKSYNFYTQNYVKN